MGAARRRQGHGDGGASSRESAQGNRDKSREKGKKKKKKKDSKEEERGRWFCGFESWKSTHTCILLIRLDSGGADRKKKVRFSIDEDDRRAGSTGAVALGWSGKSAVLRTTAVFVGLFAFFYGSIHNANVKQYR